METYNKSIDVLNELLQKNYEAEKGYRNAAEKVTNIRLKDFLLQNADTRQGFAIELAEEILEQGGNPVSETSTLSDIHRSWINFKSSIASNKDEAVIEECIRGEEAALNDYNKALKSTYLDKSSETILKEQREEILDSINELKGLEEADELL
jgi:uncharacterized protein (TIGR02284 family)